MNPADGGGTRPPSGGKPSHTNFEPSANFEPSFFLPPNTGGSFSPYLFDSFSRSQVLVPSTEQDSNVGVEIQVGYHS